MAKCCCEASSGSSVVEFLLCYLKIKGSRPAAELAQVESKWQKVAVVALWLNTCLIILRLRVQVLLLRWHKQRENVNNSSHGTVLKHLPCYPKVEGSSTTIYDDIGREKMAKCCSGSTVVKHMPRHPKVKGSSPGITKCSCNAGNGCRVAEHMPHHHKVQGLSPATAAATLREKIVKKQL